MKNTRNGAWEWLKLELEKILYGPAFVEYWNSLKEKKMTDKKKTDNEQKPSGEGVVGEGNKTDSLNPKFGEVSDNKPEALLGPDMEGVTTEDLTRFPPSATESSEKTASTTFNKEMSAKEKEMLGRVTEAMKGRLESQIPVSDNYWKVLNEYRQFKSNQLG